MSAPKCDYCGGWNTVGCGTCQQRRMQEQPAQKSEALMIAGWLESGGGHGVPSMHALRAARELRRLDGVHAAQLEALQLAKNSLVAFKFMPGPHNAWEEHDEQHLQAVDAAIAKATGSRA